MKKFLPYLRTLASLKLTLFCLASLMGLVLLCTMAQVHLGTYGAVQKYIRNLFIYLETSDGGLNIPILPGGGLIGLLLFINLTASFITRFRLNKKKVGIWLTHLGLILFVLGEFVTGTFQVETRMAIVEGASKNYTESDRGIELAVIDTTSQENDEVYSIPESIFSRKKKIRHSGLPFEILIKKYYPNAFLSMPQGSPPGFSPLATVGPGKKISVRPAPPVTADDQRDLVSAHVELIDENQSLGTWFLSVELEEPQVFSYKNRQFALAIRPTRQYLPYTVTLKDFKHDVYPGTDIPKNFSSLIHLDYPEKNESRDVLIYMNHPLRYEGKTFFQASFGMNDTLSVLQVVENPGWLIPYFAFGLMGIGLLIQFLKRFLAFVPEEKAKQQAVPQKKMPGKNKKNLSVAAR